MKNTVKSIVAFVVSFFLGAGALYACINLFPATFVTMTTKLEKDVTVNENGIADAVDKIYDAVVVVSTYTKDSRGDLRLIGSGTGFVYQTSNDNAYILTNHHVIDGGSEIHVTFTNGSEEKVKVEGSDVYSDIAVLSLDKDKIVSVAEIGNSNESRIGDTVFVVGSPLADVYSWSVTRGILSGKDRMIEVSSSNNSSEADYVMSVHQTDAAINAGNSGGPLSNSNGEVIGITSMKLVSNGVEGMGFAIPIETALKYADKLLQKQEIDRPHLGIKMFNVNSALYYSAYYEYVKNLDVSTGVLIVQVEKNSASEKSGLREGDVIIKMGDTNITSIAYLRYELYNHDVGDVVEVQFLRDNKLQKTKVTMTAKKK